MVGDVCWIWSAMMVGSDEFLGYPFSPGIIAGLAFLWGFVGGCNGRIAAGDIWVELATRYLIWNLGLWI